MRLAWIRRDERGGAAIEYALVFPIVITLVIGIMSAGNLLFAANDLHYTVQDAARCAAVKTGVCPDGASTVSYAQTHYSGPKIAPAFNYSTAGCGHTVSASASYPMMLATFTFDVPLSASACYP
jgi:Flp pilus assembly protein TadG